MIGLLATLGAHWQFAAAALGVLAFAVLLPAPALAIARWLVGSERGRYVLLLVALTGAWWWYRGSLIAEGERRCAAKAAAGAQATQLAIARAQTRGAIAALDAYMAGAAAQAAIGEQLEKDHAKALRARDRTIADLRTGNLQLRDHWACAVPDPEVRGTAAAGAGSDDAAERRREGAGDLVQVGDDSDAHLRACQATVTDYRARGVLRPPE